MREHPSPGSYSPEPIGASVDARQPGDRSAWRTCIDRGSAARHRKAVASLTGEKR